MPPDLPDEPTLRAALQPVADPELGESIVDLGLVEKITIGADGVAVTLVPTSATCPMGAVLIDDATAALRRACPPGTAIAVHFDWDTPWEPRRMSPALRQRFGWDGGDA
jgi:metal-sulfur cluster biosynthetic enzyme